MPPFLKNLRAVFDVTRPAAGEYTGLMTNRAESPDRRFIMLRAKNIWVVGGDPRQAALAALLADDGHSVHTYALERGEGMKCEPSMDGADRADCVVLPLPAAGADGALNAPLAAERHGLEEVLDKLRPGQLVCAGMAGEDLSEMAGARKLLLRDYFAREELAVLNAIPAALAVW